MSLRGTRAGLPDPPAGARAVRLTRDHVGGHDSYHYRRTGCGMCFAETPPFRRNLSEVCTRISCGGRCVSAPYHPILVIRSTNAGVGPADLRGPRGSRFDPLNSARRTLPSASICRRTAGPRGLPVQFAVDEHFEVKAARKDLPRGDRRLT